MMTTASSRPRQKLKPGSVVRCRTRRYLVEEVQQPIETRGKRRGRPAKAAN